MNRAVRECWCTGRARERLGALVTSMRVVDPGVLADIVQRADVAGCVDAGEIARGFGVATGLAWQLVRRLGESGGQHL